MPTDEDLAVEVTEHLPYEHAIGKVLQLDIVEEIEELLVVAIKQRENQVSLELWR